MSRRAAFSFALALILLWTAAPASAVDAPLIAVTQINPAFPGSNAGVLPT